MPIRLDDSELMDVFREGQDDEFDALNDDERGRLKQLVQASDGGRSLAQKRWGTSSISQQALQKQAALKQAAQAGAYPIPGEDDLQLPGTVAAFGQNVANTVAPQHPDGVRRFSLPYMKPGSRPTGPFGPPTGGLERGARVLGNVATGIANVPLGALDVARGTAEVLGGHAANLAGVPGAHEATQESLNNVAGNVKGIAEYVLSVAKNAGKAGLRNSATMGGITDALGITPEQLDSFLTEHNITRDDLVAQIEEMPIETVGTLLGLGAGVRKVGAKVGPAVSEGFSTGPLPDEPTGTVVGSGLGGAQDVPAKIYDTRFEGFFKDEVPETFTSKGVTFTRESEQLNHKGEVRTRYWKADRELPFTGGGPNSNIPEGQLVREGYRPDSDIANDGPPEGYVRLYRGQNPKYSGVSGNKGRWFTDQPSTTKIYGDDRYFVDVPKDVAEAAQYTRDMGLSDKEVAWHKDKYFLDAEWANKSKPVKGFKDADEVAALQDRNAVEQLRDNTDLRARNLDLQQRIAAIDRAIAPHGDVAEGRPLNTYERAPTTGPIPDRLLTPAALKERRALRREQAAVEAQILPAPSRSFGDRNTLVTRDQAMASFDNFNAKLKSDLGSTGPLDAVPEVIKMGAFVAEALAREAATIAVDFAQWSAQVTRHLAQQGKQITKAELQRLWNSPQVLSARMVMANQTALAQAPRARGQLAAFVREAGKQGHEAWHRIRRTMEDIDLETRMIREDEARRFGKWYHKLVGKPVLTKAERNVLPMIAEVVTKGEDGTLQFGGIMRADEVTATDITPGYKFGQQLPDGRIVGAEITTGSGKGTGTFQTYRVMWPDEAQQLYQEFRQTYPNAARTLDDFLSTREAPIAETYVEGGTAPFARDVLKNKYGVEGLTQVEMETAAAAIEQAYGNVAAQHGGVPMRMLWVPDYIQQTNSFVGRVRNVFKHYLAGPKRFKTGATRERVLAGEAVRDFATGTTKARIELMRENHLNDLADALIRGLAVERPRDAAGRATLPTGYVPLSRALYGTDPKWLTWAQKRWQPLKEFGIDLDGESHMISAKLAERLAPMFSRKAESVNANYRQMMKLMDQLAGEGLTMVQGGLLTAPASATLNLVTNSLLMTTKSVRDLFQGIYNTALFNQGDAPVGTNFASLLADINPATTLRAGADTMLETFHMDPRFGTPPAEKVGTSFWKELQQGGMFNPINRAINVPLRYLFQPPDAFARKWVTEAAQQAAAHRAWMEAKRAKATGGLTRDEFIAKYRAAIPDEINNLAWAEMDTFGAYDYWNVNKGIEWVKQSKLGRGLALYPTYVYKLLNNTYGELIGPRTQWDVIGYPKHRNRKRLANGLANLSAAAFMFKMAGEIYDAANGDEDQLPEGVKEGDLSKLAASEGVPDVSKKGRVKVPGTDDAEGNSRFISVLSLPFFNEQMLYRDMMGGKYDAADHFNQLLSSGPLFNYAALMAGMADKYNQGKAYGTRLGQETAAYVPFARYSRLARIIQDPHQRDTERVGQSEWINFRNAMMDNYPWLSAQMKERVSGRNQSMKMYDQGDATLSFLLMNTKRIDEADREWLKRAAHVEWMAKVRSQYNEDKLREDIKVMADLEGRTPATRILGAKATDDQELEARFQRARLAMLLEDELVAGGRQAAIKRLREELGQIKDVIVVADLASYFPNFIAQLEERRKTGRAYQAWKSLDGGQQGATAPIMRESIPVWQRRTSQPVEIPPTE